MAMFEAAKYSAVEELRNGRRVEIRTLRPNDRADLLAAVGRNGAESRFRRFFAVRGSVTKATSPPRSHARPSELRTAAGSRWLP
jgi:hypothetical protein